MMSPPLSTFEMSAGPPEPAKSAAPDNIDWNSTADAPIKTGSKSIPCFSAVRASLTTNQGRELMPMGENRNGTFFGACACSVALDNRNKTRSGIMGSLRTALRGRRQDGKSCELFISNPLSFDDCGLLHSLLRCQFKKPLRGRPFNSIVPL